MDPLGNTYWRRNGPAGDRNLYLPYATTYEAGGGRVAFVRRQQTSPPSLEY